MSRKLSVRNICIGEGLPKICIPIIGSSIESLLEEASLAIEHKADIIEWRADYFDDIEDWELTKNALISLRQAIGETALLFTFRTQEEGGSRKIPIKYYVQLNKEICLTGLIDLIDIELLIGEELCKEMICIAKQNDIKVIVSNHDFNKTPSQQIMVERLRKMRQIGADMPKIAVMPHSSRDIITVIAATEEMSNADCPIVVIAMGQLGRISRISGSFFGSAMTFGSAKNDSAPGQLNALDLRNILEILSK